MIIKGRRRGLIGEITVPGDKSISHRGIIIGSLAKGSTIINNMLMSEDVKKTVRCFKDMGVYIREMGNQIHIRGAGLHGLDKPHDVLDCGNSGTTMRLLSGILIGQKFSSTLTGDSSLNNRPMDRIIIPLRHMGGKINGVNDRCPPLRIKPSTYGINAISYELPVASAQVKSCILLAALYGKGITSVIENKVTRDHTERMLKYFGADIYHRDNSICIRPRGELIARDMYIPGDISSASYFMVAGLLVEGSHIMIKNVGINPTRTGIIHVLRNMGANIHIINKKTINSEPMGDIEVKYSHLRGVKIGDAMMGTLIDEIPIIAVAAALANGKTIIKGAGELKYKESDRIKSISTELKKMGADIEELSDGMVINGRNILKPATLESRGDHRIAMALSIAALKAEGQSKIEDYKCIDISYPGFYKSLDELSV